MIRTASEREDHSIVLVRDHGPNWDGYRIRIQKNTADAPGAPRWHARFHRRHVVVRQEKQFGHDPNKSSKYGCLSCGRTWWFAPKEMFR